MACVEEEAVFFSFDADLAQIASSAARDKKFNAFDAELGSTLEISALEGTPFTVSQTGGKVILAPERAAMPPSLMLSSRQEPGSVETRQVVGVSKLDGAIDA